MFAVLLRHIRRTTVETYKFAKGISTSMRRFVYLTRTIAFSLVVPPPSEHYLTKRGKALLLIP